jgi:hypothetical protein
MQLFLTCKGLSDRFLQLILEDMLITRTMLLIAIRQKNWVEVQTMSAKLAENDEAGMMEVIEKAAESAVEDDSKAQVLLSLWAQIKWLEIN